MKIKYLLAASAVSLTAATAFAPTVAHAQQTTSGVEGTVTDEAGVAISGATVTVTDTRTGQVRTLQAGADGNFRASSLPAGGPYTITATADGYEGQSVEEQYISISGETKYTFSLSPLAAGSSDSVIIVTGARARASQVAVGPGIAFDTQTLEAFPSITRDVRDIIRIDPRVSLDRSNEVDRISCLGGNDRSNTFTVDGIVQADTFGLNGTPFASRNSLPLPFDAIEQTSVEFAPFDVEYTDFTGCLVNVVTKSGTNEFHGTAFYAYRDSGLRGDSLDGEDFSVADFQRKRWGATLGGPIIKDRLFFFGAYEETDLGDANSFGPQGLGFPNEADFVDADQFARFAQIARDVYGQDVGGYPNTLAEASKRYLGRIDAYITEDHRLELAYQRLEETNVESDTGSNELTGLNSFEDEGTISNYYSARLFSEWNDTVSTELRFSRSDVQDVQGPVGFGEAQSDMPTVRLSVGVSNFNENGQLENGLLSTGPGIFRSANALEQTVDQYKFQINIDPGNGHRFKIGAEMNDLSVYNLFAINATGTLYFQNLDDFENGLVALGSGSSSVFDDADDLANGDNGGGTIAVSSTGDINDAAATFGRQIYSVYAQDDWAVSDKLDVTLGLRVQWYDGDAPRNNPLFTERTGLTNSVPFSNLDPVILPRASFTYNLDNDGLFAGTRITGGVGMFSGGDPVVYFSNAFSNNGFSSANGDTFDCDPSELTIDPGTGQISVLNNGSFTGIPACAIAAGQAAAAAGRADTQSTDPNYEVPTVLRANLGIGTELNFANDGFFSGWNLNLDYIYSKFIDPLNFVDLVQAVDPTKGLNGFTVDGRPIYSAIDVLNPFCDASLVSGGTPPVYQNLSSACFRLEDGAGNAILNSFGGEIRPRIDDFIQLTNGRSYESHVVSAILRKRFNGGVFTETGSTNISIGYAWTDSENFRNANSSTATSSFDETAAFDRQNPAIRTSNYETRHRISIAASFREEFFGDYGTQIGFYYTGQSGRPYALTFDGGGVFNDSSSGNDNAPLYIPSGLNDPNVSPDSDPAAVAALLDYVSELDCAEDYLGQSIPGNTCRENWHNDLDMRISQELPGPLSLFTNRNDRFELFADFDNFLNLLNDGWNIKRARGSFGDGQVVDLVDGGVDDEGRYIISGFNPDDDNDAVISASIWRIQVGVRYEF